MGAGIKELNSLEKQKGQLLVKLGVLAREVCPWERGDVVSSEKIRKGKPFRVDMVAFHSNKQGYVLYGNYANDSNTGWSSSRSSLNGWSGGLSDLKLDKTSFLRPKSARLAEALERVANGEGLEKVKKELSL